MNRKSKAAPRSRKTKLTWESDLLLVPFSRRNSIEELAARVEESAARRSQALLRWGAVHESDSHLTVDIHTTTSNTSLQLSVPKIKPALTSAKRGGVVFIVPTGLGASIGGFIGDAGPSARLFRDIAKPLLIHPNVANAAALYSGTDDAWYVDGFTLDEFLLGRVRLQQKAVSRVGVIIDRISKAEAVIATNAINASVATWGVDIAGVIKLTRPLQSKTWKNKLGLYSSRVENPEVLIEENSK